eukprot:scaffold5085_cov115-Cylindrotheca_fusiformis.AAC.6
MSNSNSGSPKTQKPDRESAAAKRNSSRISIRKPTSSKALSGNRPDAGLLERRSTRKSITTSSGEQIEVEKRCSLILVWILVATELGLDLVTSGIAFAAFVSEERYCCGEKINHGALPLGLTTPFFFLVVAELIFLLRAILLTLWPKTIMNQEQSSSEDVEEQDKRCCKGGWTATFMMLLVNFLTIVNPFFGFAISWMLMYQSDKNEAFIVMGIEAATIILHFLCVYLENAAQTWISKLMHGAIIIPWLATLSINIWYLNKGGVCYETALETFWYKGCEICPNGMRPVNDTLCPTTTLVNGMNETTYDAFRLWELDSATSCDGGNDVCWFPYT